jgi:hypothetical protein
MACANPRFREEATDPLDKGYGRMNNCFQARQSVFPARRLGNVHPVHALATRLPLH